VENGDTGKVGHTGCEDPGAGQRDSASNASSVGYKRPPVKTRFKKGQSGNLKGRPKGIRKLSSLFDEILRETVRMREGDKVRRISAADALIRLALNGVIKGEPGAINALIFLAEKTGRLAPSEGSDDGRRYGYLIVPKKMSPEQWDKAAQRALKHVQDPDQEPDPRFKQQADKPSLPYVPPGYKLCRSVETGEPIIRPIT